MIQTISQSTFHHSKILNNPNGLEELRWQRVTFAISAQCQTLNSHQSSDTSIVQHLQAMKEGIVG